MDNGLVRIHLGGALGRTFGAEWTLAVSSPAEAIRAINVNTKGKLREYLSTTARNRYYKIAIGREDNQLDKAEVTNRSGTQDIYILPTVKGRNSGVGKILAAIVIVVLTYLFPPTAAFWGSAGTAASVSTALYSTAFALAISGVVQLLTPVPSFDQGKDDGRGSNIFGGNATTITQGAAVGLVYGRALVSPMPISLSLGNFDQAIANTFEPGTYTIVYGPGGVVTYVPHDPVIPLP